ncbi:MAG: hypothetical protein Q4B29_00275 [Candidatus Saccharibacteria bacterium]|nr:hypothetical protein [Candidatus Saccharibacteria bacterium]
MAKEVAIMKRAKISQAQQLMLLSVLGASLVLGAAISLVVYFLGLISFNANVIAEEEKAIVSYSNAIEEIGICTSPSGEIYTDEELNKCDPNSIETSLVPGTLRANILENMAANEALASVPNENSSECMNPFTNKNYTYEELQGFYSSAETSEELNAASKLIQSCSALRVIPDALPAFKNEEALLASLNKIFLISGWEPDSLSPTGTSTLASFGTNLNSLSLRLAVEANTATTMRVIDNIEHSIRDFSIERATIEWGGNNTLILQAQATAFYMTPSTLQETTKNMKGGSQ